MKNRTAILNAVVCSRYKGDCFQVIVLHSFPHHFDDYALAALSIEFTIKDTLPGAEIDMAISDGDNHKNKGV